MEKCDLFNVGTLFMVSGGVGVHPKQTHLDHSVVTSLKAEFKILVS